MTTCVTKNHLATAKKSFLTTGQNTQDQAKNRKYESRPTNACGFRKHLNDSLLTLQSNTHNDFGNTRPDRSGAMQQEQISLSAANGAGHRRARTEQRRTTAKQRNQKWTTKNDNLDVATQQQEQQTEKLQQKATKT